MEIGVLFNNLESGNYKLSFITNGSKKWTKPGVVGVGVASASTIDYFFTQDPVSITLFKPEKEKP